MLYHQDKDSPVCLVDNPTDFHKVDDQKHHEEEEEQGASHLSIDPLLVEKTGKADNSLLATLGIL